MSFRVSHHLLLCATPTKAACCNSTEGKESWEYLKILLKKYNLEDAERPEGIVLRSKVDCLRICNGGPILLIWPDGVWYGGITPERIRIIIEEHLIKGRYQEDWIIKKTILHSKS